jgi:hypothetical protein
MEGTHCSSESPSNCTPSGCTCGAASLTLPIHDYNQAGTIRQAVTGGYVYRGCAIPDLRGEYFFADFASAEIWSFRYAGSYVDTPTIRHTELAPPVGQGSIGSISSFGEDANGEIYICDLSGGEIFKIVPTGAVDPPTPHDYDNNGVVNLFDMARFRTCLTGPAAQMFDCLCDVFDTNTNTGADTIDLRDFADFQGTFDN